MRERPWPITTAAILLALIGWLSLLSVSVAVGAFPNFFFRSLWSVFGNVLVLDILASLSLAFFVYRMQKWSYVSFWIINFALISHLSFLGWETRQEAFKLFFSIWIAAQIIISIYLLTPNIRQIYFNPRLRWWETAPRYKVNLRGKVRQAETVIDCEVIDLSAGGAFISSARSLIEGDIVKIHFNLLGLGFDLEGRVLQKRGENSLNYALTFVYTNPQDYKKVDRLCKGLGFIGVVPRTPQTPTLKRIKHWAKEF